jgi:hypothetical protein
MKNSNTTEIRNLIVAGMKISAEKLLEKKKKLGQKIVISENGIIRVIHN